MAREVSYGSGDQSKTVVSTNSDILSHDGTRITTYDEYGKKTGEVHQTPDGKEHVHDE